MPRGRPRKQPEPDQAEPEAELDEEGADDGSPAKSDATSSPEKNTRPTRTRKIRFSIVRGGIVHADEEDHSTRARTPSTSTSTDKRRGRQAKTSEAVAEESATVRDEPSAAIPSASEAVIGLASPPPPVVLRDPSPPLPHIVSKEELEKQLGEEFLEEIVEEDLNIDVTSLETGDYELELHHMMEMGEGNMDEEEYPPTGYQCEHCPRAYKRKNFLYKHLARAHGVLRGVRDMDGFYPFETRPKIKVGPKLGERGYKFMCDKCPRRFYKWEGLITHQKQTHKEVTPAAMEQQKERDYGVQCPVCFLYFAGNHAVSEHVASMHAEYDEPMFYCDQCKTGFKHYARLRQHLRQLHKQAVKYHQGYLKRDPEMREQVKRDRIRRAVERNRVKRMFLRGEIDELPSRGGISAEAFVNKRAPPSGPPPPELPQEEEDGDEEEEGEVRIDDDEVNDYDEDEAGSPSGAEGRSSPAKRPRREKEGEGENEGDEEGNDDRPVLIAEKQQEAEEEKAGTGSTKSSLPPRLRQQKRKLAGRDKHAYPECAPSTSQQSGYRLTVASALSRHLSSPISHHDRPTTVAEHQHNLRRLNDHQFVSRPPPSLQRMPRHRLQPIIPPDPPFRYEEEDFSDHDEEDDELMPTLDRQHASMIR